MFHRTVLDDFRDGNFEGAAGSSYSDDMEWGNRALTMYGISGRPFTGRFEECHRERQLDGSESTQCQEGRIFVDRSGRTRIEWLDDGHSSQAAHGLPSHTAFVHDSVSGILFVLDLATNTVIQQADIGSAGLGVAGAGWRSGGGEPIGTRTIEGDVCDGFRTNSGDMVAESWVSRVIGQVVEEEKRSAGSRVTYRLFDVRSGDPDPVLFVAP